MSKIKDINGTSFYRNSSFPDTFIGFYTKEVSVFSLLKHTFLHRLFCTLKKVYRNQ